MVQKRAISEWGRGGGAAAGVHAWIHRFQEGEEVHVHYIHKFYRNKMYECDCGGARSAWFVCVCVCVCVRVWQSAAIQIRGGGLLFTLPLKKYSK